MDLEFSKYLKRERPGYSSNDGDHYDNKIEKSQIYSVEREIESEKKGEDIQTAEKIDYKKMNVRERLAVVAITDEDNKGSSHLILFLEDCLRENLQIFNSTEILRFLSETCASTYVPLLLFFIENLQRSTTGKLDRPELKRNAEQAVKYDMSKSVSEFDVPQPIYLHGTDDTNNEEYNRSDIISNECDDMSMRYGRLDSTNIIRSNESRSMDVESIASSENKQSVFEYSDKDTIIREIVKDIIDVYKSVLPISAVNLRIVAATAAVSAAANVSITASASITGRSGEDPYLNSKKVTSTMNINTKMELGKERNLNDSRVWGEIDFYSLGGDSLRAVEAVWRLGILLKSLYEKKRRYGTSHSLDMIGSGIGLGLGSGVNMIHEIIGRKIEEELKEAILLLKVSHLRLPINRLALQIFNDFINITTKNGSKEVANRKRKLSFSLDEHTNNVTARKVCTNSVHEDGNDRLNILDLDAKKKMKMGINHVEKNLESTQKLLKVSVHGRTDKWVWHADLEGDPSRLENTEDIEEMDRARTDSEDSYLLNPVWSSPLVKCVDSSPLVIVRYYNPNTPPLSGTEGKEVVDAGMLFIGSHGGDFTAVDYKSGETVWTVDLNSKWKGSGRVHIEGSASCDMRGDVVYVGCFRGEDVDGSVAKEQEEQEQEEQEQEEQQQSGEGGEQGDRLNSLGRVFAFQALTGQILWSTPIGGEIKGSIAGNKFLKSAIEFYIVVLINAQLSSVYFQFYRFSYSVVHRSKWLLVGSYDGKLYVLSQDTGKIIRSVSCGGSIYASPILRTLTVHITANELINRIQNKESIENNHRGDVIKSASENIPLGDDKAMKIGTDDMEVDTNNPRIKKHGQCKGSTTLLSTVGYICTTHGNLLAVSFPSDISEIITDVTSHNEDVIITAEDVSLPVLWEFDAGAPIFSTPLVTSTIIATEHTDSTAHVAMSAQSACTDEQDQSVDFVYRSDAESSSCHGSLEALHLLRTDTVIFGVVDSTVRCLSVRSRIPITDSNLRSLVGLSYAKGKKLDERRKMRGIEEVHWKGEGEEIWRVSFASKPVFTSICSIDHHRVRNHFLFQLSLSSSSFLSLPSIEDGKVDHDLSTSMPFELSSIDDGENFVEKCVIIFGSHDGHIRGISSCGDLLWETDLGSILFSSPCVVFGTSLVVAATTAGIVYVLDCGNSSSSGRIDSKVGSKSTHQSESLQSETHQSESHRSDPHSALGSDLTNKRKDFTSSKRKSLGAIVAHTRLQGEIFSSPVVYKNMIYIGCRDDRVHAIALNILNYPY